MLRSFCSIKVIGTALLTIQLSEQTFELKGKKNVYKINIFFFPLSCSTSIFILLLSLGQVCIRIYQAKENSMVMSLTWHCPNDNVPNNGFLYQRVSIRTSSSSQENPRFKYIEYFKYIMVDQNQPTHDIRKTSFQRRFNVVLAPCTCWEDALSFSKLKILMQYNCHIIHWDLYLLSK